MNRFGLRFLVWWCWISGGILVAGVGWVIGFVLLRGLPALDLRLLFGSAPPWQALLGRAPVFNGLYPAVLGTVTLVVVAVGLAAPIGMATGIYLAEFARGRAKQVMSLFFDVLAGIPSIVIGLSGFSLSIFLHRAVSPRLGPCLLISALALALLVLPYLIRATQTALEALPAETRLTAVSLGADRIQNLCWVLLPNSLNGILSGVILAIGRCAEDTAVILLTGVVATAGVPRSLFDSYEALPFYIYYVSTQYADAADLERAFGAAVILLGVCLVLFAAAFVIRHLVGARALTRG